jgi:oligopeptide/dipeptide ABC transporter ATP-binding protein
MDDRAPGKLIEIDDLRVTFAARKSSAFFSRARQSVRAVDGVSLDINEGEILAVVGESGCGKTTMGKAILNIVKPTGGSIKYRGRDLEDFSDKELRQLRQKTQLIYQDPYESLDPRQSVYKTLREPLAIHRADLSEREKRVRIYNFIESVGLRPAEDIARCYPHHLSGGQRQRVAIAAAMILEPDFVIADEPVSMLDVSVRAEILKLMFDLRSIKNLTYMFITHDLSLAWMISNRIAVFYLGKMVEIGEAAKIVHHSAHPYSQALVSVISSVVEPPGRTQRRILRGETPSPLDIPPGCRFHTRCWLYQEKGCPEICRLKEPALEEISPGHDVACFFI